LPIKKGKTRHLLDQTHPGKVSVGKERSLTEKAFALRLDATRLTTYKLSLAEKKVTIIPMEQ